MLYPEQCPVCGALEFEYIPVLWAELVDEWELNENQKNYMNKQQGLGCKGCGNNLRVMAIAHSLIREYSPESRYLDVMIDSGVFNDLRVLEVNSVGNLSSHLQRIKNHKHIAYPEYDFQALSLEDDTYDIVLHSDTLEHIPNFKLALSETHRILNVGGVCIFTIPLIVERLTRSRKGLPASFHGIEGNRTPDYFVHTEFGADFWTFALEVGFSELTICNFEYPSGLAIKMRK
ncbi:class I SAM-dependent methyltransferase [Vibrio sp. ZSDZ65]|uniref:Class I SAM-dependent methyltransferase n=1 Tax=Vibrio qingdaonensis TaxID=2829491 RepID=A0A9X3CRG0_9VIBR|nr:methyltransferase domain-containing protein [Vibrio qingdaonensis]MCW8348136.1 class I SAM-dependent methyltransferase [Vibrio qingdaonensis]